MPLGIPPLGCFSFAGLWQEKPGQACWDRAVRTAGKPLTPVQNHPGASTSDAQAVGSKLF